MFYRIALVRMSHDSRTRAYLTRQTDTGRTKNEGQVDEFSARDALLACRKAVAYMGDMHRACTFEANNPNSIEPEAFGQMADAAEGCMKTVSGVEGLGSKVFNAQGTIRRQAERHLALPGAVRASRRMPWPVTSPSATPPHVAGRDTPRLRLMTAFLPAPATGVRV